MSNVTNITAAQMLWKARLTHTHWGALIIAAEKRKYFEETEKDEADEVLTSAVGHTEVDDKFGETTHDQNIFFANQHCLFSVAVDMDDFIHAATVLIRIEECK